MVKLFITSCFVITEGSFEITEFVYTMIARVSEISNACIYVKISVFGVIIFPCEVSYKDI